MSASVILMMANHHSAMLPHTHTHTLIIYDNYMRFFNNVTLAVSR